MRRSPGSPLGPGIRGAVEGIEVTQEPDVGGTSTVYRFYLQRYDQTTKQPIPPSIPVEMRGRSVNNAPAFDGSLNERDWVEIPGVWQGQILHPDRVYIIPRAAFFTSRGENVPVRPGSPVVPRRKTGWSPVWKGIRLVVVVAILFLLLLWGPGHLWPTFAGT